jgi:hypothetical protein
MTPLEPEDDDDPLELPLEEVEPLELADGVLDGCCRLDGVVAVELVVLPWVVSAATNENIPASPTAPAIIQRLIRESSARPRSREG